MSSFIKQSFQNNEKYYKLKDTYNFKMIQTSTMDKPIGMERVLKGKTESLARFDCCF